MIAGLPSAEVVAAVLADVNLFRAGHDLPPMRALLRGQPRNKYACPIARTAAYGAGFEVETVFAVAIMRRDRRGPGSFLTIATCEFIRAFDNGVYPGLDSSLAARVIWQDVF